MQSPEPIDVDQESLVKMVEVLDERVPFVQFVILVLPDGRIVRNASLTQYPAGVKWSSLQRGDRVWLDDAANVIVMDADETSFMFVGSRAKAKAQRMHPEWYQLLDIPRGDSPRDDRITPEQQGCLCRE